MTEKEDDSKLEEEDEKKQNPIHCRYKEMKEYFLTYLQCCYGAFIAVFIGIVAVPFLPISQTLLKGVMVVGFWIVGLYYLASIVYVYGQLAIAYELSPAVIEDMSPQMVALGFPHNLLEKAFKHLRKPRLGKLDAKYIGISVGYFLLLAIFIFILLKS
jgi:hypothetical protein